MPCEDRCPAGVGSPISQIISILGGTLQGFGDDDVVAASESMSILVQKPTSTRDKTGCGTGSGKKGKMTMVAALRARIEQVQR